LNKISPLDINALYTQADDETMTYSGDGKSSNPENLNEKFKSGHKTLLETLGTEKKEAIIDLHEKKLVEGIKKSITINQRFMFEKDLFKGNKDEFEMVINYLDNCKNKQEALEFINENYTKKKNWDKSKEEVIEFFEIINKRFLQ
jgi:hypothetical protein